jgi:hypothetical protein
VVRERKGASKCFSLSHKPFLCKFCAKKVPVYRTLLPFCDYGHKWQGLHHALYKDFAYHGMSGGKIASHSLNCSEGRHLSSNSLEFDSHSEKKLAVLPLGRPRLILVVVASVDSARTVSAFGLPGQRVTEETNRKAN